MQLIEKLTLRYGAADQQPREERGQLIPAMRPRRYRRIWVWVRPGGIIRASVLVDEIPEWYRIREGHQIREPERWEVVLYGADSGVHVRIRTELPAAPDEDTLYQLAAVAFPGVWLR